MTEDFNGARQAVSRISVYKRVDLLVYSYSIASSENKCRLGGAVEQSSFSSIGSTTDLPYHYSRSLTKYNVGR